MQLARARFRYWRCSHRAQGFAWARREHAWRRFRPRSRAGPSDGDGCGWAFSRGSASQCLGNGSAVQTERRCERGVEHHPSGSQRRLASRAGRRRDAAGRGPVPGERRGQVGRLIASGPATCRRPVDLAAACERAQRPPDVDGVRRAAELVGEERHPRLAGERTFDVELDLRQTMWCRRAATCARSPRSGMPRPPPARPAFSPP